MKFRLLVIFSLVLNSTNLTARSNDSKPPDHLLENEKNTINVFQRASKSVVNVRNVRYQGSMFSWRVSEVPAGSGSGFIWDDKGHIVTNYHVIRGASKLVVQFENGNQLAAKKIGEEPRKDIAVLKVNLKEKVSGLTVADSGKILVGQKAIAIGSPFGLDQTLTVGTVSAQGRSIPGVGGVTIQDMIQTDASINPGNSGGPLLDSRGYLMGMNTVIFSESGSSAGIGFAVPSNTIKRIVNQIIKFGHVKQAGIGIQPFTEDITERYNIQGILIRSVLPRGPAAQAGLRGTDMDRYGDIKLGDLITKIDGKTVNNYDELYNTLESMEIGTTVTVEYVRDKKTKTAKVKLVDISDL
jgi:S1-C subfamily serine protease